MKTHRRVFGIILLATGIFVGAGSSALATEAIWNGDGDGSNWLDPNNWDVDMVPCNNLSPDTYNAIIDDPAAIVDLAADCTVDSLGLRNGATLNVSAGANLTVATATGLLIEGSFNVVDDVTIDVSNGLVTIVPKGVYQPHANAVTGEASALLANEITIMGGPGGTTGGSLILDYAMTVSCAGNFLVGGPVLRGGATPPVLSIRGSASADVSGDLSFSGSVDVTVDGSGGARGTFGIELAGNFNNQITTPESFDVANGSMLLKGISQTYEVGGVIRSTTKGGLGENFVNNFAFGTIDVSGTSTVTFQDLVDNSGTGVQESLFVDRLTLEEGAAINVNDSNVYFNTVVGDGVSVSYGGNGHLAPVQSLLVPTTSHWGMILFTVVLLIVGTIALGHPRRAAA